ncbi:hypothetical protein Taro_050417, partial [Colocasia esculenta]|nr:hypothetical protein [Colocasia esculenta]
RHHKSSIVYKLDLGALLFQQDLCGHSSSGVKRRPVESGGSPAVAGCVKETRIDILVTQYERFQMQSGECITQLYSRFTDITNWLAGLGKTYEIGDMARIILRSLPASWTTKVTAIEEANDLRRMSLEKLIGSLMAHEINMERLGESSTKRGIETLSRPQKTHLMVSQ